MLCPKHALQDCPLCKNIPRHVQLQQAKEEAAKKKIMRKHRTKDPYKYYGMDRRI